MAAAAPGQKQFTAQGVLREALVKLWEQARAAKVAKIGAIEIQMYEAGDAFKLLGMIGGVSNATKSVAFVGGYGTKEEERVPVRLSRFCRRCQASKGVPRCTVPSG